jgi:F-type H+-transporting ATPase subunit alpha
MRQVAGRLRLELAQFRELEAFAKFGSEELDKATKDQLERGRRITEILKQPINTPMSLGKQASILYAVTNGYLDDVGVEKVISWEENFHRFMETNHPEIQKKINTDNEIKPETENLLKTAITDFKKQAAPS